MNWRWPARRDNNYAPLYKVVWRFPFVLIGWVLAVFAASCFSVAYLKRSELWDDLW